MKDFDKLASILFSGNVVATDFKCMPGDGTDYTRDELAATLLDSMKRVGLVVDGHLVEEIKPKG